MSSGVVGMGERKAWAVASLLLLITSLLPAVAFAQSDGTIRVPRDFPTIQEAVDAANPGDTIQVSSGTYREGDILINKALKIVGENSETTIIDGYGHGKVIHLQNASNTAISNFTIRSVEVGILLNSSQDRIIENNVITTCTISIYLSKSAGNRILNNTLLYTQLVTFTDDEFTARVAHSEAEACQLIETGFDYVCDFGAHKLFRKRK